MPSLIAGNLRKKEKRGAPERKVKDEMVAAILLLILVAILFGVGFAAHALFWIALALLAIWLVGWLVRPSGGRWYYW